jgi:hypothetical protein
VYPPTSDGEKAEPLAVLRINHHVTRTMYEVGTWWPLEDWPGCVHFAFQSRYRTESLVTHFEVCYRGEGDSYRIRNLSLEGE